ncbi:hypothetical protein OPQ81_003616 [Rhizoctonia solani]|nr:hypothetical protein OPQ81_003616 [Rhizoctonia solani]
MQVLYGALVVLFILCSVCSRLPNTIASLHLYISRGAIIGNRTEAQQSDRVISEEPFVQEPGTLDDDGNDDQPVHNAVSSNYSVAPSSTRSFYALIIGINDYPNLGSLKGATADADKVAAFLTSDLRVPPDQVINLRNQDATREAIIQRLRDLRDDPRIAIGDPILIYYAGHGGSHRKRRVPVGGGTIVNEVQVIFPYDYGVHNTSTGEIVNCIPDYTIAKMLNELAAAKGDNITVVFDSCHSASGSRDGYEAFSAIRPRCAPLLYDIPYDDAKTAPSRTHNARAVDPIFCTDQASHVLLAACGSREKAWEQDQQGQFTTALLATLKARGVENLTYHNLIVSLPKLINQSPHCYGANKSRILFDSRVSSLRSSYIPVRLEKGVLVLGAGAASGITFRSVWEIYDSAANDSQSLGRFVAEVPRISTTLLTPETDKDRQPVKAALNRNSVVQPRLYARQVGAGVGNELKVWVSPQVSELLLKDNHPEKNLEPKIPPNNEVGYVFHSKDSAEIGVEVGGSNLLSGKLEVAFSLFDPLAEKYNVSRLSLLKTVHWHDVEAVLFAAAKWNWHLRRTNPHYTGEGNHSMVRMEIYKIGKTVRGNRWDFFPTHELISVNYNGTSSIASVELVADGQDLYGVKLSNRMSIPLYIKVFFFDATDFSIVHLFGYSTSSDQGDPELPACADLVIGDGNDGGSPLTFTIPPEKNVELGYLKVFWSTDPLELDDIVQVSAFDLKSSRGVKSVDRSRAMKDWGTACLALVQCSPTAKQ